MRRIILADNMDVLPYVPSGFANLIYIDPPFNTGRSQSRTRLRTVHDDNGDRTGFAGKKYRTIKIGTSSFPDHQSDYLAFLEPRVREAHRILAADGSLFFHIDYREAHYCKLLLDHVFGRDSFINEIIWAYDYGARSRSRWSPKHDNILWYAKDPRNYTFNYGEIDRVPYMAPSLVSEEKAARGKTLTDVWWNTIVPTNGKERNGYPTQKPMAILSRIIRMHSRSGDIVMDFFAGSGTTGEAAEKNGRHYVLIDNQRTATRIMRKRLGNCSPEFIDLLGQKKRTANAVSWKGIHGRASK